MVSNNLVLETFRSEHVSGYLQSSINGGRRSSAATAYLAPQFLKRPNLHILLGTRVLRVLKTSGNAFRTVEFAQSGTGMLCRTRTVSYANFTSGPRSRVTARKEIILSAGAIGTPHILMNSGIGDPNDLTPLGIPIVLNLPSVGKNLTDQPLMANSWSVSETNIFDQ